MRTASGFPQQAMVIDSLDGDIRVIETAAGDERTGDTLHNEGAPGVFRPPEVVLHRPCRDAGGYDDAAMAEGEGEEERTGLQHIRRGQAEDDAEDRRHEGKGAGPEANAEDQSKDERPFPSAEKGRLR